MAKRSRAPAVPQAERAQEILSAALRVFIEKGFAAARIEDVAREAGLAKGTLYLYFDSKVALFKGLIQTAAAVPIGKVQALLNATEAPTDEVLRAVIGVIKREIFATDRKLIVRLVLTEVHRFPELADFYYVNVVSRAMQILRAILERGLERGEIADDSLVRFPQLIIAPFLVGIMWQALFDRQAPLDVEGLMQAHLDILIRGSGRPSS